MQTKTLFFIVLGVVLFLSVYGYFRATPGPLDKNKVQPQIEVAPTFFDFGKAEYGKILRHTFSVKNTGNSILRIKRIATSCACTRAEIKDKKSELKPGEKTQLIVTYDTGAMSGPHGKGEQKRIIFIQSNDPSHPQVEIKIRAYVY